VHAKPPAKPLRHGKAKPVAAAKSRPASAKAAAAKPAAERPAALAPSRTPARKSVAAPANGNGPKAVVSPLERHRNRPLTPAGRRAIRSALEPSDSNALIHGIPPYQPQVGEPYMSDRQLDHFRQILLAWKRELMEEVDRTVHHMQDEASNFPDPNDRATQESEFGLELRTRDRERKLLKKIDSALERIDSGTYGYCEEPGEEIGLKRLEARPVATLSVEAQERRELSERQYGERDDRYR
jgi:DnaK suppressor protein